MKKALLDPQRSKYVRREVRKLNITQQIKDLRELYDAQDPDMEDLTVQGDHLS